MIRFFVLLSALSVLAARSAELPTDGFCSPLSFEDVVHARCPPLEDLRCARGLTRTRHTSHVLSCGLIEAGNSSEVMIVDGDVLMERLKHVDPFGRSICSLVFFYSPTCVFSSRVAGYVYSLAHLFPKLRVYALNVDNKAPSTEQLINQHGVAATPVLFLFENHVARVRMHDDSGSFRLLVELLLKRTDLRLPPTIKRDDLNRIGNASNENAEHFVEYREFIANFFQFADMSDGIDRYYILANIILLLNVVYFVFIGPRLSQWFPANQR
ncbi:Thioredoxin domain-containing protein 15-like protein [Aphelenchoides fujianensis]|nr:Thioredoxin domain-containing protein 15-like protein [Aphelenchoides fujianensis]